MQPEFYLRHCLVNVGKRIADTWRGDSRWALRNESDEEIHVVDEGVVVRAGEVFGMVLVGRRGVVVHVDEALLHTGHVTQVLWQGLGIEGIFSRLGQSCED